MHRLRELKIRLEAENRVEAGADKLSAMLTEAAEMMGRSLVFDLPQPHGCICPGDATPTCKSFSCPRKGLGLGNGSPICGFSAKAPHDVLNAGEPSDRNRYALPGGPQLALAQVSGFLDNVAASVGAIPQPHRQET